MAQSEFEFFMWVSEPISSSSVRQRLPEKFAKFMEGREPRKLKLCEVGDVHRKLWDVEVVFDGVGPMFLGPGWKLFALSHDLHRGHFSVCTYDGVDVLTVKVFDGTMCRKHYHYEVIPDSVLDQFCVLSKGVELDERQRSVLKKFCAENEPETPLYICRIVKSHIDDGKGKMYFNHEYTRTYLQSRLTTDGTDVEVYYNHNQKMVQVRMKIAEDNKAIMTRNWRCVTEDWKVGNIIMFWFQCRGKKNLKLTVEEI